LRTITKLPAEGASAMTSEFDRPKPTIADEVSPVVDDQVVIEKTLPAAAPDRTIAQTGYLDRILDHTRDYVRSNPVRGALVAAGCGALLTELLVLSVGRKHRRPRQ
jgi:hypothetical protein